MNRKKDFHTKPNITAIIVGISVAAVVSSLALVGLGQSVQASRCTPAGHCPSPGDNFMTGGGVIRTGGHQVTHGFELHCNEHKHPNNLEVNWDGGNNFHLEKLLKADCFNDPSINPKPPRAGHDTFVGEGTGRLNGVSGATAEWTLTDAGEPGTKDALKINIFDSHGSLFLSIEGNLDGGNHQAHDR